jgi:hypothetical protein
VREFEWELKVMAEVQSNKSKKKKCETVQEFKWALKVMTEVQANK